MSNGDGGDNGTDDLDESNKTDAPIRVNGDPNHDATTTSSDLETPLEPPSTTVPDEHLDSNDDGPDKDKISDPEASPAQTQLTPASEQLKRARSPLVLAPVTNGADPHSSPASTDEHDSNTPAPERGSPNTSPEDEDPTITTARFNQSKADTSKGPTIPRQPDTPDSTQEVHPQESSAMEVDSEHVDPASNDDPSVQSNDSQTPLAEENSSQKPSMRINTQTNINAFFKSAATSSMVESPAPMTNTAVVTPRKGPPPTPSQDSSKRNTRISSGVLQKKSVSEILGETPKATSTADPMESADARGSPFDLMTPDRREKDRSRLSTVVFAKPQKHPTDSDTIELVRPEDRDGQQGSLSQRDYLYSLFENKAYSMTRQGNLNHLIQNAHKSLSTSDHLVDYQFQNECRILKRIYQLQEKQRWALRQYQRADEASRPTSHWDYLLDHMKWMRTDFRHERRWKLAAARDCAESCARWFAASPEERLMLQVKVRPPRILPVETEAEDVEMPDGPGPTISSQPTPDLIPSHEEDSASDDIADLPATVAPAEIFSLGPSDFTFAVDRTPAFDKLLDELPLYAPASAESGSKLAEKFEAHWKTDIVPVSRYAVEKLPEIEDARPTKRSRYDYELELSPTSKVDPLPPKDQNVALFMPENRHIRDRIHPGHSFRPPSEHPMPSQAFFETRNSSQWTHTEDDELRKLVKDYSYNWSLISSCLTPSSLYSSGADRRTPWECFERWIGLEGLPADMSKTPYFKTYSGRIEAAGRNVAAQIEEAQRRAGANVQIPARKRTTQPVRVDRKRNQRHLAMVDVMRKLQKKRETQIQKQQHQADLAAMRKVSEISQPKAPFKRPQEYAALRQERDQKRAEQQEMYRQQLLAHQRAVAQTQRAQNAQANSLPNGMSNANAMRATSSGMPGMPNGNLQVPNGHPRPHPAMMAGMNGSQIPPSMMGPKNFAQAQAQLQAGMARGITSPQQMRMLQEASKVQQEQLMRQAQQQAAQSGNPHSSPNNPNASLVNGMPNAYMAALAATNGAASPSNNPNVNGTASSPRSQSSNPAAQALSSGHIPILNQVKQNFRERYPHLSDQEIDKLATQQLTNWQQTATAAAAGSAANGPANVQQKRPQALNQAALNAAMGAVHAANAQSHSANAANVVNANMYPTQTGGMMTNEQVQQYTAQRMRMQQAQARNQMQMQQMQQAGMQQAGMMVSPVMQMARPVSQHSSQGQQMQGAGSGSRSATPREMRGGSQGLGGGQQGSPRPGSRAMQA